MTTRPSPKRNADVKSTASQAKRIARLASKLNHLNWSVSSKAAAELVSMGPIASPALIQVLSSGTSGGRRRASQALKALGTTQAIEPLIAASQDEDWLIRWAAVDALGNFGDARVVEALLRSLKDENANVRWTACQSLQCLGDVAVPFLTAAVNNENREVRTGVVLALSAMEDERKVEPLIAALEDQNSQVRSIAAEGLAAIRSEQVIAVLIKALSDVNPDVRAAAAQTLGELRATEALPILERLAAGDTETDWEA
jgi:HEAT repeat protein